MPFYNQRKRGRRFIFFPFIFILLMLALGGVVMLLWNAILPDVTGVKRINYFQATGLLLLCRILFGNFKNRFGNPTAGMHRGGPWREKWMKMSPEERSRFREAWRERCRTRNK